MLPETDLALCLFLFLHGPHKEEADQQRYNVQYDGDIQHVLISCGIYLLTMNHDRASRMFHDKVRKLIACEACEAPCGEGQSVDGADVAHAVMIGEEGRDIGEAAAVACVHYKDQSQHQYDQQSASFAVLNASRQHDDSCEDDGENEDKLINGISVLHGVRPCGKAETAACVEDGGYGRDDAYHSCETDTFHDHLFLRDQGKTAGDVDVEHKPDTDVVGNGSCLDDGHHALTFFLLLGLMPVRGLFQQDMPCKHHDKVDNCKDQEHLVDAAVSQIDQHCLHDRAGDSLCCAEACDRKAGGKALSVLKPQHQGLYGGQIARAQTDAHDETVAYIDADQGQYAAGAVVNIILAAVIDEEACTGHACGEADGGDKGGFVDVLFYHVPQKCRRHPQKEDREAEGPFCGSLGEADVAGNLLAEDGPAVDGSDATVQQQRRDSGAYPFVLCFHVVPHFFFACFLSGKCDI